MSINGGFRYRYMGVERDLVINRVKIRSDPFIYISEVDFKVQLKVPVQLVGERKSNEN
jgi:hypothetical protein